MSGAQIREIVGRGVWLPGDDVDTDQIIPARFLKLVSFRGLGELAFYDARHGAEGQKLDHPLNDPRFEGASVLLTGRNFGCGSSREHAPQSLYRAGFRAILAESFADIFFGNALALGLPCVSAAHGDIAAIGNAVEADPSTPIRIDVEAGRIEVAGRQIEFEIVSSARDALLSGQWDPLSQLTGRAERARAVYERLPYTGW